MKRQRSLSTRRSMLWATLSAGWLTAFSAVPALAANAPVNPAVSVATDGDWVEVFVGFGLLLVIGLGGLWFTQHQLKFR